jgi:hypothetical protein
MLILSGLVFTCRPVEEKTMEDALFTLLSADETGVDFANRLEYTESFNPYTFRNFFNGGGVGFGDVNNDGLIDIFLCGNQVDNKLYLNLGDFKFKDITGEAGVASSGVWTAGVSIADVNGDGWQDIYLCKSGSPEGENRHNELFINNGPGAEGKISFTEKAAAYGIDDLGLSTHAAFFDYDKDGDLDLYLLNNSIRSVGGYDLRPGQREIRDTLGGNKLYRNDSPAPQLPAPPNPPEGGGRRAGMSRSGSPPSGGLGGAFVDVSAQAGIYGSNIGFGLGVTIGDVNRDGWLDIYVSNDFFERDYLYINNRDGTFTEVLEEQLREISLSSMGADMADLNNDGYPEIFVTDMLPEEEDRLKTKTTFEDWDKYQLNLRNGYYRQFTRNVLQLNNADGTFSEIGRLADVEATDWSWGALIADLDNNGWKDIFVANGIFKDLTDQDYINFYSDPRTIRKILTREGAVIQRMIDTIPSEPLPNYAFSNEGEFPLVNRAEEWGLGKPGFSNGSAYGDLDNDGDLDLVINNVNMPAFIYRNNAERLRPDNHYLQIKLEGPAPNTLALGAQVTAYRQGEQKFQELAPMRGFQSSVDPRLHFGLGDWTMLDSVVVRWPDGRYTVMTDVPANQQLTLQPPPTPPKGGGAEPARPANMPRVFSPPSGGSGGGLSPPSEGQGGALGIDYRHRENEFDDFDRDRLIYHMLSTQGPKVAVADVNGDGREDFFIGGARESAGALFVQQPGGRFRRTNESLLEADKLSEDTDCLFFDADGDGDADLYVASGGNEFPTSSHALIDRLYLNDGGGNFTKSDQVLPTDNFESTGCVDAADYDGDGDLDLFVGIRLRPFLYGVPVNGYILENDGTGKFRNITEQVAPELEQLGLLTDARWLDYDVDGDTDLLIAGEWMPLVLFINENGRLTKAPEAAGLAGTNGFWNTLAVGDVNGDGRPDFIAGNHGLNTRMKASPDKPVSMYINDFDRNGSIEQLITVYNGEEAYPLALRHDLVEQMPGLKKKYLKYKDYKEQTIRDIFTPEQLAKAIRLEVYETRTMLFLGKADGSFESRTLPLQAQYTPIYGLLVRDLDGDNNEDILMGGNFYWAKPEVGIHDAGYGLFLRGDGQGNFVPQPARESGFFIKGEVRDIVTISVNGKQIVLAARNNAPMSVFVVEPEAMQKKQRPDSD